MKRPLQAVKHAIALSFGVLSLNAAAGDLLTAEELIAAQAILRRIPVGDKVVEAILDLVRACRPG